MAKTYEPIATYTFPNSSTASYTFSNIPATYDDLSIIITETGNSGSNENGFQFNGDTSTANYAAYGLYARTSGNAVGWSATNEGKIRFGGNVANLTHRIEIVNYRSSYWKYALVDAFGLGSGINQGWHLTGCWKSTSAITSIKFDTFGSGYGYYFQLGTQITLYGIKRA